MLPTWHHVAVAGAGTLGLRITYLLARGGKRVRLKLLPEESEDAVRRQLEAIAAETWNRSDRVDLDQLVDCTHEWEDLEGTGILIEAVPEDLKLKQEFFVDLEPRLPEGCVLLSNSSSLTPSLIFERVQRPERCGALHFFLPPEAITAVELAPHPRSEPAALWRARALMEDVGYRVFELQHESPGLVWNRINYHYTQIMLESQRRLDLSRDQMDLLFPLVEGVPCHWLLDFIGLDIIRNVGLHLREQLGPRYGVPELLEDKVATGELGVKAGQGFWEYPGCRTEISPWDPPVRAGEAPDFHPDGNPARIMVLGDGPYGLFLAGLFSLRGARVQLVVPGFGAGLKARLAMRAVRPQLQALYGVSGIEPGPVQFTSGIGANPQPELVFDALPDDLARKRSVLDAAIQSLPDGVPVALGSAFFSVEEVAQGLAQPQGLLGAVRLHGNRTRFDLFPGPDTNSESVDAARRVLARVGCDTVTLPDGRGRPTEVAFAAAAYEYLRLLEEGTMERQEMDELLRAVNTPVDFSFLIDEAGLDYLLDFSRYLAEEWGPVFQPPALLERMVEKGYRGLKNGRGLRQYRTAAARPGSGS